jgi:hypothetical protein
MNVKNKHLIDNEIITTEDTEITERFLFPLSVFSVISVVNIAFDEQF